MARFQFSLRILCALIYGNLDYINWIISVSVINAEAVRDIPMHFARKFRCSRWLRVRFARREQAEW